MRVLLVTFLSFIPVYGYACVNLGGTYTDDIMTLELTQTSCEKIVQKATDWFVAFSQKAEYGLDGREYIDPGFKNIKGEYAYKKAEIDKDKLVITFRRGNPFVKERTLIKTYRQDSDDKLVIESFEIKGGVRVLKDKWVLGRK